MAKMKTLTCLSAIGLCACYTYVPATLETVPDGARVRALISPDAADRLQRTYHIGDGSLLTGSVVGRHEDSLQLYVPAVLLGATPFGTRPLYQQVDVAQHDVMRVDIRQVDKVRTVAMLAVASAALAAVGVKALSGHGEATPPPPPPPPTEAVRGWGVRFSIPWP